MNFDKIENLVLLSKNGDEQAKEKLVQEFLPLIINLSTRSFINGYDPCDIQNECYQTLFKCLAYYNLDTHRFVAYATNAIKNTVYYLIRTSVKKSDTEGSKTLIFTDTLENLITCNIKGIEEGLISKATSEKLEFAISNLSTQEKEILIFVIAYKNSIKDYAKLRQMNYSTAVNKKNIALDKLKQHMCSSC